MSVTGYLALYTTLIGWQQYQNLWALMVGTGLVFIPFIGLVSQCFLEPFESQEPKNAAVIALRRLMIRSVGALLVIEFCCVPTVPLTPRVLHFEPACVSPAKIARPGHTGTTYDNQYPVPTGVKVPIIWYLVMAVSNGFTHAAIQGIHCQPINYRRLQSQLDAAQLTDPVVKKQTINFYNDCYIPAYSHYLSGDLTSAQKTRIQQLQKQYGRDELGWIGSRIFLETPDFYDQLKAHEPVVGFLFDPVRDQYEGQVRHHSRWGKPSCRAWWSAAGKGLHAKLQKALPVGFVKSIIPKGGDAKALADIGIRQLIRHSFDPGMSFGEIARGYESLNDDIHGNIISEKLLASIGLAIYQMTYYPKLALLIDALPIIQALLLMSLYMLLALVIPFSSYRLHFIITGAALMFAVTFWSYLWHIALYVDNTLIPALFPHDTRWVSFREWLHGDGGMSVKLIDFVIGTLYTVLPMLFLTLMSWAGLKVSNAIMGAVSDMKAPGDAAGSKAGAFAEGLVKMIAKALIIK